MTTIDDLDEAWSLEYIERLHKSFPFFMGEVFKDRGLDKKAPISAVEIDILQWAANGPRRRGVLAFRGMGKTHLITAGLTCWRFFRDPNRKVIIPSKSLDAAKKTVYLIREWFEVIWFLNHLRPNRDQRDAATYLDVGPCSEDRQPSLTAIGIDGQLENNRAHTIIPDDVETKKNTLTLEGRQELDRITNEFTNILYPDAAYANGECIDPVEIVYVGTYKHDDSLYIRRAKAGYTFRSYPIAVPKPGMKIIGLSPEIAERMETDGLEPMSPTVPLRFPRSEIADRMGLGMTEFYREHMLVCDTGQTNRYPLRLSDLLVMKLDRFRAPVYLAHGDRDSKGSTALQIPTHDARGTDRLHRPAMIDEEWAPYTTTKAWIDPAGRGTDKTGLSIVAHLNGFLFVKACLGLRGGADSASLDAMARLIRFHGVRDVYYERNIDTFDTFGTMLQVALRKLFRAPGQDPAFPDGWACSVTPRHSTVQKEIRICDTLEPVTSNHRLVVDVEVVAPDLEEDDDDGVYNDFQYQFTNITRERKCLPEEAKLDSLAGAVSEFNLDLGVNVAEAAAKTRDDRAREAAAESWRLAGIELPTPALWTPYREIHVPHVV